MFLAVGPMRSPPDLTPVTWIFLAKLGESQKQTNDNETTPPNQQNNNNKNVMNIERGFVGADKSRREIGRHIIIRMQFIHV